MLSLRLETFPLLLNMDPYPALELDISSGSLRRLRVDGCCPVASGRGEKDQIIPQLVGRDGCAVLHMYAHVLSHCTKRMLHLEIHGVIYTAVLSLLEKMTQRVTALIL